MTHQNIFKSSRATIEQPFNNVPFSDSLPHPPPTQPQINGPLFRLCSNLIEERSVRKSQAHVLQTGCAVQPPTKRRKRNGGGGGGDGGSGQGYYCGYDDPFNTSYGYP